MLDDNEPVNSKRKSRQYMARARDAQISNESLQFSPSYSVAALKSSMMTIIRATGKKLTTANPIMTRIITNARYSRAGLGWTGLILSVCLKF